MWLIDYAPQPPLSLHTTVKEQHTCDRRASVVRVDEYERSLRRKLGRFYGSKKSGSTMRLAGDFVCEFLPCMFVGALFAWVASKALACCVMSEIFLAKAFFGISFVGFSAAALAMSYIVLIALVEFSKEVVRKEP